LVTDHELADSDGPHLVNARQIQKLCSGDWGLYTTVTENLEAVEKRIPAMITDAALGETVRTRIAQLTTRLEQAPKSAGWKMRATIGRRVQWYMLPEEVVR
jgi:hypothetical protein